MPDDKEEEVTSSYNNTTFALFGQTYRYIDIEFVPLSGNPFREVLEEVTNTSKKKPPEMIATISETITALRIAQNYITRGFTPGGDSLDRNDTFTDGLGDRVVKHSFYNAILKATLELKPDRNYHFYYAITDMMAELNNKKLINLGIDMTTQDRAINLLDRLMVFFSHDKIITERHLKAYR